MECKLLFKRFWWLGVILTLIIISLLLILNQKNKKDTFKKEQRNVSQNSSQDQSDKNSSESKDDNCSKDTVLFTHEFTDYSKISAFAPIGSISGASRGRSYIEVQKGETVPVYAPMDATLVSIIYAFRGPDADHGEYGFKFNAKCGVTFLLDHLDSVSSELKQYAPGEPSRSTATDDKLSIPVKAGTLLGETNGTSQARTFDFLVMNKNSDDIFYINPDRWQWDQSKYSVCPYDLFAKDIKDKYYQKIGLNTNTGLNKAKSCGDISYDIADTISGGWFKDENANDLKGEFMLIGERMNGVDLAIKTDSEGAKTVFTDFNPQKLPKDVGIGEAVCYRGFNNDWHYLHLIDSKTIEIKSGSGACPASFVATGAVKYYR